MVGSWKVDVVVGKLPQTVATAMGKLNENILGAEYTPIAYLGSQVVNGTNHAVLAEQLVVTGKDTKNIVTIIFNEKPGSECTLVSIERVLESGGEMGGVKIDVQTGDDIDAAAKAVFAKDMAGFVGSDVNPFALLGTQVVRGMDYIFAAEVTPVTKGGELNKKVALVTVNSMTPGANFVDILASKQQLVGYAFTWLGAPLGEWP